MQSERQAHLEITVNGRAMQMPLATSLSDLIAHLAITGRFAVEVNGEIVPRSQHQLTKLTQSARIEIVQAIGGG
jgi:sulfur carrier protein